MTIEQAQQQPEAKEWTIKNISGKFQPRKNGLNIGIAHKTLNAARIFITCQIHCNSAEYRQQYEEARAQALRDWDA
jgi:hypothetical protein